MSAEALKKTFSVKGVVGIVLSVIVMAAACVIPGSEQLSREGVMGLGIMVTAVVLWICETFPAGVTGILVLVLAGVFNVVPLKTVFSGFGGTTVFFVIGVFSLTILMMKTNLGQRLTRNLIKWAGPNSKKLVLAFMIGSAVISTVMTDTGAVVITMGLALPFLEAINHKPGSSNLGKCIMLGVAFAAIMGGFCTPAGHSMNVLALGMLGEATGQSIGFLQWMVVGIPFAIVMIPICWFFLTKILKPEALEESDVELALSETQDLGKFSTMEKKALVMLIGVPVLWILGNWIPVLDTTTVAVIGLAIMFLPGMNLLTWEDMQKGVPWNIILMLGGILSLGSILGATGGAAFIANLFLSSGVLEMSPLAALLLIGAFAYLLHTFLPVAPAILTIFLPPLFAFAQAAGISPAIPMLIVVAIVSGNFILPLNPTITVAYAKGYFTFGDVAKAGIIPAVLFVAILVPWVYFIAGTLGLGMA
ncbi:carboxylate transporter [Gordonibacter sp. 28C]|uniref:SLC13 family permease n=1 Tax=Gordonibacter sp. 28C TaxID=2078569 RepID=UPI000DF76331|nr:DASS family sodium-coupled anion symporter [Gordonibacter sp. 28C]RDB62617.1 carboxylate transporter [Gordonibacter sp. 28C]